MVVRDRGHQDRDRRGVEPICWKLIWKPQPAIIRPPPICFTAQKSLMKNIHRFAGNSYPSPRLGEIFYSIKKFVPRCKIKNSFCGPENKQIGMQRQDKPEALEQQFVNASLASLGLPAFTSQNWRNLFDRVSAFRIGNVTK